MVAVSNAPDRAVIDRIEGKYAVHNGCIWERSVLSERINGCVQEGLQLEVETAVGSFCHVFLDGTYYFSQKMSCAARNTSIRMMIYFWAHRRAEGGF